MGKSLLFHRISIFWLGFDPAAYLKGLSIVWHFCMKPEIFLILVKSFAINVAYVLYLPLRSRQKVVLIGFSRPLKIH